MTFLAVFPGTSTDVSRVDGHFDHTFETTTAGVTIQAPQVGTHRCFIQSWDRFPSFIDLPSELELKWTVKLVIIRTCVAE